MKSFTQNLLSDQSKKKRTGIEGQGVKATSQNRMCVDMFIQIEGSIPAYKVSMVKGHITM